MNTYTHVTLKTEWESDCFKNRFRVQKICDSRCANLPVPGLDTVEVLTWRDGCLIEITKGPAFNAVVAMVK